MQFGVAHDPQTSSYCIKSTDFFQKPTSPTSIMSTPVVKQHLPDGIITCQCPKCHLWMDSCKQNNFKHLCSDEHSWEANVYFHQANMEEQLDLYENLDKCLVQMMSAS